VQNVLTIHSPVLGSDLVQNVLTIHSPVLGSDLVQNVLTIHSPVLGSDLVQNVLTIHSPVLGSDLVQEYHRQDCPHTNYVLTLSKVGSVEIKIQRVFFTGYFRCSGGRRCNFWP